MVTMANQEEAREDARQPATPFTLVVSDVHAFPEFLENALRRSGFRAGIDTWCSPATCSTEAGNRGRAWSGSMNSAPRC